ncbi:glutathione peroxidase [Rubellimicrobium rubrum]|uniref:Glutathione peroxidase n=1 Tax=Rubellimicrobium rubrum TaxID=2585369 RepID=A0A5C4MR84_9RHOB|nr:glutathione peroxidase [Rubellimicrobium rubrum]TNC47880.1 glutathione peroxidase [Rubellimicrobium rubrum]
MQYLAMTLALAFVAILPSAAIEAATPEEAQLQQFRFNSIDGGQIGFGDWVGHPVLIANTASLCGYTPQYADLQALYDSYRDRGLVVVAVPSDDFRQELASDAEVKDFCELNYDLDLPMTGITPVRGEGAHPFFAWLRDTQGFEPQWNFNKVLIGADGKVLGSWGSGEAPTGPAITQAVEAALRS